MMNKFELVGGFYFPEYGRRNPGNSLCCGTDNFLPTSCQRRSNGDFDVVVMEVRLRGSEPVISVPGCTALEIETRSALKFRFKKSSQTGHWMRLFQYALLPGLSIAQYSRYSHSTQNVPVWSFHGPLLLQRKQMPAGPRDIVRFALENGSFLIGTVYSWCGPSLAVPPKLPLSVSLTQSLITPRTCSSESSPQEPWTYSEQPDTALVPIIKFIRTRNAFPHVPLSFPPLKLARKIGVHGHRVHLVQWRATPVPATLPPPHQ
ncbi:hypothetical protein E1B28_003442 [Marasmius oreades]|uniref:Uncharacterized protein n=1 Tax=Marasmius oreades TaxID=181124 RepID=A0A9P7UKL4_9AGAR|nr:uncharacterized protein E1B28_003442 [Marasmius oreades]KAG7085908.1 hypothetical protein E1B28_003442 [Marasmius oreades]